MNPIQLLAHFDKISDAPDAIPRLRRFVLDLAVRGKLVPQDPKDESASLLLGRISTKRVQAPAGEGASFSAPAGWALTTLGTVATVVMGQSPPGDTYNKSGEGLPLGSVSS